MGFLLLFLVMLFARQQTFYSCTVNKRKTDELSALTSITTCQQSESNTLYVVHCSTILYNFSISTGSDTTCPSPVHRHYKMTAIPQQAHK